MRASKLKSILDRMSLKIQDKLGGKKLGDFMSAKTKLFKSGRFSPEIYTCLPGKLCFPSVRILLFPARKKRRKELQLRVERASGNLEFSFLPIVEGLHRSLSQSVSCS
eukprot:scaffold128618_cov15-Tisochrysis_lutea.AAC.1